MKLAEALIERADVQYVGWALAAHALRTQRQPENA